MGDNINGSKESEIVLRKVASNNDNKLKQSLETEELSPSSSPPPPPPVGTFLSPPAKPTISDIETSGDYTPRELTPRELFEKVASKDVKQNQRLSARANGSSFKSKSSSYDEDPNRATKMRFLVCTLGLVSLAMSQMSRMVLNQTITQMVDKSMLAAPKSNLGDSVATSDGSCPATEDEANWLATTMFPDTTPWPPVTSAENLATTTLASAFEATTVVPGEATTIRVKIQIVNEDDLPDIRNASPDENLSELPDFDEATTANGANPSATTNSPGQNKEPTTQSSLPSDTTFAATAAPEVTTLIPPNTDTTRSSIDNDTSQLPHHHATANYPTYMWDMKQQSLLLGGFYYSYFVFMVLGGRMAEIYGAKYVLLLSVGGSALINIATPWMARTSFVLLVMSRIVMGAIQAGVFPGMYALIAKWLTMTEASIYAPLIKMNLRLGMVLGSMLPGFVSGWPQVYYLTGALSAVWSLLWLVVATSDPADNKWVSRAELNHINRKKQQPQAVESVEVELGEMKVGPGVVRDASQVASSVKTIKQQPATRGTPWVKLLTAPSIVGLIIVKLTFNYALDFLAILLPSYLTYVHHVSNQKKSFITSLMFAIQVLLIVFVGWLAKVAIQRRPLGLDKTGIRKLFQGVASFGMSATFLLLTFNNCNLTFVIVLLQLISLLSMFTAGGETMLPYDLSQEYPATIMAIANSVANLSGITTTVLSGLVLSGQGGSYDRWNILIRLIAGANLLGGLSFMLLVKAEPIDFSDTPGKLGKRPLRRGDDIEAASAAAAPAKAVAGLKRSVVTAATAVA